MIKIRVTGDLRMIANSAWISTTSELRAKSRSDEDVNRVVSFLAKNMHTSPFESVTVSVYTGKVPDYIVKNKFAKVSSNGDFFVVDLLNFAKIMHSIDFNSYIWIQFCKDYTKLSEVIKMFDFNFEYAPYEEDLTAKFEDISVEFIDFHKEEEEHMSRATWRVKCPLSIAVQLLRHRSGSYNMVSGRYKTIRQELVQVPNDINNILNASCKREKSLNLDSNNNL